MPPLFPRHCATWPSAEPHLSDSLTDGQAHPSPAIRETRKVPEEKRRAGDTRRLGDAKNMANANHVDVTCDHQDFCFREILSQHDSGLPSVLKGCGVNLGEQLLVKASESVQQGREREDVIGAEGGT